MSVGVDLRAPEVRTHQVAGLELREVQAGGRWLEGRAVPYGTPCSVGWFVEVMSPGVFAKSIREAANGLPLLMFHNAQTWPVGRSERWTETDAGLDGVWRMDTSEEATRAAQLAADGMLTGMSVGFVPIRSEWSMISDEEWDPDLGPDHMDSVTRLEARLLEVSLTPTPAYSAAQVSLVRSREANQHGRTVDGVSREVEAWRRWLEGVKR